MSRFCLVFFFADKLPKVIYVCIMVSMSDIVEGGSKATSGTASLQSTDTPPPPVQQESLLLGNKKYETWRYVSYK